jgi:glycosyltransferase involved in cell wall biosynthesis
MNSAIRVAHIVENLTQGGIKRVVITLSEQMIELGVETHILLLNDRIEFSIDPKIILQTIPITGLSRKSRISKWTRKAGRALLGTRRYWHFASPWFCQQLQHQIARHQFTCLYFHGLPVCWPFHRWHQSNSLFVLHNTKSAQLQTDSVRETRWNYAAFANAIAGKRLIAVSDKVRKDTIRTFHIAPSAITTVYNPFDLALIRRLAQQPPQEMQPIFREGYFLFVGRLVKQKRIDILLQAYQQANIPEHLLILGRGEQQTQLTLLARKLGIAASVHFLGFQSNPYPYMRHAKALVLPSEYEGFGNVIIEALTCGTQVISTRTGGAEEILIGPLAKGLVAPGNVEQLVEKLRKASQGALHCADVETMLSRFDKSVVTTTYLDLIKSTDCAVQLRTT